LYVKSSCRFVLYLGIMLWASLSWVFGESQITMFTAEIGTSRRVIVSLGDVQPTAPDWIVFTSDSATGKFSLTFRHLTSNRYLGRKHILERGVVPIQLSVSFPDSESLTITGKSLPFRKVWSFWVVDQNEFIVDFFQEVPPETIFHEKTLSPGLPQAMITKKIIASTGIVSPKTEARISSIFKRAVLYATLILVFGLSLIFGFQKKKTLVGEDTPSTTAENTTENKPSNPGRDKEAIRRIMKTTGQTWDEAALTLSLGRSKDYGRV